MSVYFYGCVTMDGYLADKAHNLDRLYQSSCVEERDHENFYKKMDITIMGKRTFSELEKKEALRRFRLEEVKKYGQFAELVYVRE